MWHCSASASAGWGHDMPPNLLAFATGQCFSLASTRRRFRVPGGGGRRLPPLPFPIFLYPCRLFQRGREHHRRKVAMAAVRPLHVVCNPQGFENFTRFAQCSESWRFRHSSRQRPLKLSMKGLSVGVPGLLKHSVTPCSSAHRRPHSNRTPSRCPTAGPSGSPAPARPGPMPPPRAGRKRIIRLNCEALALSTHATVDTASVSRGNPCPF